MKVRAGEPRVWVFAVAIAGVVAACGSSGGSPSGSNGGGSAGTLSAEAGTAGEGGSAAARGGASGAGGSGTSRGGSSGGGTAGGGGVSDGGASGMAGMSGGASGSGGGSAGVGGCPMGNWGCPVVIAKYLVAPTDPELALDAKGNAFAAWVQFDHDVLSLWASRFDAAGKVWSAPALLETDNVQPASEPKLSAIGDGGVIAVWAQGGHVWSSRYVAGSGSWSSAVAIENQTLGISMHPRVAADGAGNVFALWERQDSAVTGGLWATRYDPGTATWTSPVNIKDPTRESADEGDVAVDGKGNAFVVFEQFTDDGRRHLLANRYDATGHAWGSAQLIEPATITGKAVSMRISVSANGDAFVAWWQQDTQDHIWVNRYDGAAKAWGQAERAESSTAQYFDVPHVATDAVGNAFVVWPADDHVFSNRYDVSAKHWVGAARLDQGAGFAAKWTDVAADASGNAFAIWAQSADDLLRYPNVTANRFDGGNATWASFELVETPTGETGAPQVVMDGSGHAFASWWQFDGVNYTVWANRSK